MRRAWPFVALVLAGACSSDPIVTKTECVPGESIACGGSTCSKVCGSDGKYGACTCVDASVPVDSGVDAPPDVVDAEAEAEAEAEAAVDAGPIRWGHAFAPPDGTSFGVAVDKNQNVIVCGKGSGLGASLTKLSPGGAVLWQKTLNSYTYRVAVDSVGAVYVTGQSPGNVDFGGGVVAASGTFLAKYDASGAYQWLVGPFAGWGYEVRVRANGNVILVGTLQGSGFDFGGGTLTPSVYGDALLVELTASKAFVRAKLYPSVTGVSIFFAAALDASDNLFVSGTFDGASITFGGAPIPLPNGSTTTDLFVVKFDPTFTLLKQADGHSNGDSLSSLSVDPQGKLYVGGNLGSSIQFGTTPLTPAGNGTSVWLALLDANLNEVWAKRFGGASGQQLYGVAADPAGGVVITGWTGGNLYFGIPGMPSEEAGYIARFDGTGKVATNRGLVVPNSSATGFGVAYHSGTDFIVTGTCGGGNLGLPSGPLPCTFSNGGNGFAARMTP